MGAEESVFGFPSSTLVDGVANSNILAGGEGGARKEKERHRQSH